MKKIILSFAIALSSYCSYAQNQIITTGNNVIDTSNPYAADAVIGSNASGGIRHDASIMWWSNSSASRISNTSDVFYYSVWNTTTPNVALAATLGGSSYFQGKVGIGTTTPMNNLQIGSFSADASTSPVTLSLGGTYSSAHGFNPKIKVYDNGINFWGLGISSDQLDYIVDGNAYDHVFYAGGNELMRVKGSGNVAIGTDDPKGYKLAVNGSAIATSMTVKLYANWPDYVFKNGYQLPSLAAVKTYIDKNEHLPDMPSEQQVKDNGINLGEMVRVQTKKIEELTLYLIEKDKQLAEQQKEIDYLKKHQTSGEQQEARIASLEKALSKLTSNQSK